ncbi:methyltransferase domain-containing protein [Scytonema sp. UIC 10036]|uniref:methyltransferase domain-containing protein n=1 Tax=Scytonema sp. UIC 10036 TaxID=2304196 RepID=UPI0012DA71AA|nr:methyltransferase domain-containing protein [Scytonema sp. UIC 10036]MUG98839.1 methyltransferase domain-containing protein [Scytonema sp. UIC 10036]
MLENYTPGYSTNATQFMAHRTAKSHAAFFMPYLNPEMKLLDCGCGPGTITLGLAQAVFPGTVTGIDLENSQLDIARESASKQSVGNVDFIQASVYHLPFPDSSFDAVFAHAVFEHLQKPLQALQEILRVLKPGGKVGVRSPDWGGFLIAPSTPELDLAMSYYKFLQQHNGGNVNVGRELGALLRQAGFTQIKTSASYESYEPLSLATEYLALRIQASEQVERAVERGWTDVQAIATMNQALQEWSLHPDRFFAQAWCEAIGHRFVVAL